jgi:hypothetical protein
VKPRHRPATSRASRPPRDRAGAGHMYRCKYPREFHQLAALSICGGLTFSTDREKHLRECHNVDVLPVLVDEMFETVVTDERQEHGKYGKYSKWCECGTAKPIEASACPTCHERDKYDRANRVMGTYREGQRSEAGALHFMLREERRREGRCVACGHAVALASPLHCQPCLDAAAERKRRGKRLRSGTGDGT